MLRTLQVNFSTFFNEGGEDYSSHYLLVLPSRRYVGVYFSYFDEPNGKYGVEDITNTFNSHLSTDMEDVPNPQIGIDTLVFARLNNELLKLSQYSEFVSFPFYFHSDVNEENALLDGRWPLKLILVYKE